MATSPVGAVVLIRFAFSDLTDAKLRPAFVLAAVGGDDFVLCQITSRRYRATSALPLSEADFLNGSLSRPSFVRPEKLFTANGSLIKSTIGRLRVGYWTNIVNSIEHVPRNAIRE